MDPRRVGLELSLSDEDGRYADQRHVGSGADAKPPVGACCWGGRVVLSIAFFLKRRWLKAKTLSRYCVVDLLRSRNVSKI